MEVTKWRAHECTTHFAFDHGSFSTVQWHWFAELIHVDAITTKSVVYVVIEVM